jgi:hypothetical protein
MSIKIYGLSWLFSHNVVTITLGIGHPSQLARAQPQDQQQPHFDNPAIGMQNCPAQNAWDISASGEVVCPGQKEIVGTKNGPTCMTIV